MNDKNYLWFYLRSDVVMLCFKYRKHAYYILLTPMNLAIYTTASLITIGLPLSYFPKKIPSAISTETFLKT